MKNTLVLFALITIFISCNKKNKVEQAVQQISVQKVEVIRFDKLFFESKPQDLAKLKTQFPYFFPAGTEDAVWVNKIQDPMWQELYLEVQKKYTNIEPVRADFETLLKHIKYYFPQTKTPKLVTLIAEMDYNNKAIYADSLVLISLELYLGKNHKFYEFPNYIKQNLEQNQIMPDIVSSFAQRKIAPPTDKNLLSQMIYFGKQLYLKDLLLPDYSDANKMGYTPEQIKWCEGNESYMWRYFVEREILYSSDQKLASRFINVAPFSKFYLEIDNDSPGQVGSWLGWQIVRSYMKNNETSLENMLQLNAAALFEKSKYKPKKE